MKKQNEINQHEEQNRAENARGLATSFQHMRDMINTYVIPEDFTGKKALWVTLNWMKDRNA